MADIKQWITVHPNGEENKGQPIPVEEGQTKADAVKHFIAKHKNKNAKQLSKELTVDLNKNNDYDIFLSTAFENEFFQKSFNQLNLTYIPINTLSSKLTENEIIKRVSGGDKTIGSCTSLAFAYLGNKIGLDVLDFRGGESLNFFGTNKTIQEMAKLKGVKGFIVRNEDDYKAITQLIKNIKDNKEYILTTGKHTSIIKKENGKYYYLELQDKIKNNNGFKKLNNEVLKQRFKCKKTNSLYGLKLAPCNILIDCDSLGKNKDFKKMLGYINTNKLKQKKGDDGSVK